MHFYKLLSKCKKTNYVVKYYNFSCRIWSHCISIWYTPELRINKFGDRVNQLRGGMTKNEVREILKRRPKRIESNSDGLSYEYDSMSTTSPDLGPAFMSIR